ncbi:MAG: anti-sigma factor [Bacteroidota bacterium]
MDKETFIKSGLIEQYVMGLTSPEERAEVERMAAAYPEIDKRICEMQDCMKQYVEMHAIPPPKRARQRILGSIDEMEQMERRRSQRPSVPSRGIVQMSRWVVGSVAAVALLLVGACVYLLQQQNASKAEMAQLSAQMESLQSDYAQLRQRNNRYTNQYVVLKDIATKHVAMNGTAHAPGAKVVVYWNDQHSAALLNVINLPDAPHGHQYQVWADVNGKHVNMGLLDKLREEKALHNVSYINNSKGVVITLEKEGGSEHPSTDKMYATGEISM